MGSNRTHLVVDERICLGDDDIVIGKTKSDDTFEDNFNEHINKFYKVVL